jgi:hypothetical protein
MEYVINEQFGIYVDNFNAQRIISLNEIWVMHQANNLMIMGSCGMFEHLTP